MGTVAERTTAEQTTRAAGSPIEAVDRALLVLEALAPAGPRGMGLAELASRLDLHKTTLHRVLAALRHRGFVAQDPTTGAYLLGGAATRLADDFLGEENLPVLLHPALVALCAVAGELVHLGVLSGGHVVYLDKVEPERSVRVWSAIGRRSPAVTTALGRALLAYRGTDRAMLAGYVGAVGDRPVDGEHVWSVLEHARATGYATEDEENEGGISCVAVPLLRSGSAIAAVSVTAPAERMTPERRDELHAVMRRVLPPLLPDGLTLPG
nr:IclR family transcriptional regulator [Cellulomonas sp. APG4]